MTTYYEPVTLLGNWYYLVLCPQQPHKGAAYRTEREAETEAKHKATHRKEQSQAYSQARAPSYYLL